MMPVNEMLLFGAGASVEAKVPAAFALTDKIVDEFRNNPELERYAQVVSFVIGGLLFDKSIHGQNALKCGINVEEFFNAVEMLANRHALNATPFVGSWHAMIEEFDKIEPPRQDAARIQKIIYDGIAVQIKRAVSSAIPPFKDRNIDTKISEFVTKSIKDGSRIQSSSSVGVGKEVGELVNAVLKKWADNFKSSRLNGADFRKAFDKTIDHKPRPGEGRIFREVVEKMIGMLVNLVFVDDIKQIAYLSPLGDLVWTQKRVVVASLNYDNCVELFCENSGIPCETGIEQWSRGEGFPSACGGVLLLKLHGSINWETSDGECAERPMPHRTIRHATEDEMRAVDYWPAVIFGHRNKLTAEGPFLDLLRAFHRELTQADRLTVVGYSFADPHINVFISQWINSDPSHRLRIVNGPDFGDNPEGYFLDLLTHVNDRVEIIRKTAGDGLADLFTPMLMDDIVDSQEFK